MTKDIFISHAWGFDELNRDNHKRCLEIYNKLSQRGFSVWIDESDMKTNIDLSIINGIDNAKIILLCLTKKYCDKINYSVYNNMPQDNCYKEWNYSIFRQKYIIPILMEDQMKNVYVKEKGIIQMYLNNMLYIDASSDINKAVDEIINQLKEYNLYASITPNNSNNSLFDYFSQISPSKKNNRSASPKLNINEINELSIIGNTGILQMNHEKKSRYKKYISFFKNLLLKNFRSDTQILLREKSKKSTFKIKNNKKKDENNKNIDTSCCSPKSESTIRI